MKGFLLILILCAMMFFFAASIFWDASNKFQTGWTKMTLKGIDIQNLPLDEEIVVTARKKILTLEDHCYQPNPGTSYHEKSKDNL